MFQHWFTMALRSGLMFSIFIRLTILAARKRQLSLHECKVNPDYMRLLEHLLWEKLNEKSNDKIVRVFAALRRALIAPCTPICAEIVCNCQASSIHRRMLCSIDLRWSIGWNQQDLNQVYVSEFMSRIVVWNEMETNKLNMYRSWFC